MKGQTQLTKLNMTHPEFVIVTSSMLSSPFKLAKHKGSNASVIIIIIFTQLFHRRGTVKGSIGLVHLRGTEKRNREQCLKVTEAGF